MKMKKQSKIISENNFFIKLYKAKEKHWLRTILILSASGVISFNSNSICKIFNLTNNDIWYNIITISSLVLFWAFFIATVLIQISDVVYKKYLEPLDRKTKKDLNFNLQLIGNVNNVCKEKLLTLTKIIGEVKSNKLSPPPQIINKPCNQLRNISEAICNTISYSLNGDSTGDHGENDVRVNIFYRLTNEKNPTWEITHNNKFEYPSVNDIVDNSDSLFNLALKESSISIMKNNKKKALDEHHYVPCDADDIKQGDPKGSILYYKMPVKDNTGKTIIEIIVMVYTCNTRFADDENADAIKNAKYNIDTILLRFKPRIQIEMCLYYLYYLRKQYISTQNKS